MQGITFLCHASPNPSHMHMQLLGIRLTRDENRGLPVALHTLCLKFWMLVDPAGDWYLCIHDTRGLKMIQLCVPVVVSEQNRGFDAALHS